MCVVQVCWFFPLEEQIRRLLAIKQYRKLLMYEAEHRRITKDLSRHCMSDIYDSPRWNKIAGRMGDDLTRIVLHMSVDGVPAFGRKACKNVGSVKPIQYFVANLAPWLRSCCFLFCCLVCLICLLICLFLVWSNLWSNLLVFSVA